MANWFEDMWNQINRPVNIGALDEKKRQEVMNRGAGFSDKNQMGDLHKRSQYSPTPKPAAAPAQAVVQHQPAPNLNQPSGIGTYGLQADSLSQSTGDSNLLTMLQDAIRNKDLYSAGDSPYMANLNSARSASLKAIADARNSTNANFEQSNTAIGGIYAKGKQDTLADNAVLQDSNANLVGGLDAMYDGSIKQLQDDRSQALNERAEMAARFGLQGAGLGDAGEVQNDAIADTSQLSSASQDKALQYGAADVTANTARASSLTAEGAGRQAQLRSQLSGILGQLSNKELDVNNQYAQHSMQAQNQAYQDNLSKMQSLYSMYDKERSAGNSLQSQLLKSPVIAKLISGGGSSAQSMTGIQGANALIGQQGGNAQDYNNAYSDAIMNVQTVPGMEPSDGQLLEKMVAGGMDRNLALAYIQAAKQNKSTVSVGGNESSDISGILGMLLGGG